MLCSTGDRPDSVEFPFGTLDERDERLTYWPVQNFPAQRVSWTVGCSTSTSLESAVCLAAAATALGPVLDVRRGQYSKVNDTSGRGRRVPKC
jgi:hypothetical protein